MSIRKLGSPGGWGKATPFCAAPLIAVERASSTCATPSVATSDMSFGALRSRRMMPSSVTPASAAEMSRAGSSAIQYGTPQLTTAMPNTAVPKAPISPCAKLMTLSER